MVLFFYVAVVAFSNKQHKMHPKLLHRIPDSLTTPPPEETVSTLTPTIKWQDRLRKLFVHHTQQTNSFATEARKTTEDRKETENENIRETR